MGRVVGVVVFVVDGSEQRERRVFLERRRFDEDAGRPRGRGTVLASTRDDEKELFGGMGPTARVRLEREENDKF